MEVSPHSVRKQWNVFDVQYNLCLEADCIQNSYGLVFRETNFTFPWRKSGPFFWQGIIRYEKQASKYERYHTSDEIFKDIIAMAVF